MNKFVLFLGVALAGTAAYVLLSSERGPQFAEGPADDLSDAVDDFSDEVQSWGTRKRVGGVGNVLGGRVKQGVGRLTGNDDLEGEGLADAAVGHIKNAAGQAAQFVSEAAQDLKR